MHVLTVLRTEPCHDESAGANAHLARVRARARARVRVRVGVRVRVRARARVRIRVRARARVRVSDSVEGHAEHLTVVGGLNVHRGAARRLESQVSDGNPSGRGEGDEGLVVDLVGVRG